MIVRSNSNNNSNNNSNMSITVTKLVIGGRVATVLEGEKGVTAVAVAVAVAVAERENEKITRNESILGKVVGIAGNTTIGGTIPMMIGYLEAVTTVLGGRKVENTKSISVNARGMKVVKDKWTHKRYLKWRGDE